MEGDKLQVFFYGLLSLLEFTNSARVLGVFPMAAKSHFHFNEAMMKSLHAAGHHITFISPFPSNKQLKNYSMIDSRSADTFIYVGQTSLQYFQISLYSFLNWNTEMNEKYCYDIMKLKIIQEALSSPKKLYDVMFVELRPMYQCYLPIAEKLNIPVIGTVVMRLSKLADAAIGQPVNPAIIPLERFDSKLTMSFRERLENVWRHLLTDYHMYFVIRPKINQFYQKYFPDLESQNKKKVSLAFYNSHASLLSRPTVPNVVEVAGVHIQPANRLPHNLLKFIDKAESGVILFTFGSVANSSSLPVEVRSAFVNAFAAIPQRVIWKFDEPIDGISSNVLLSSWVPQRDILDHENVKVFISHCGISGVYEAIYTGTPIIATPLFGDQISSAAILDELGVGVRLDWKTVTTQKVLNVLNKVINDTGYTDRMQKLSQVFKDRPTALEDSIVHWTEYVIRYDGASHLQSAGSNMPLYQYFLLDIALLVTVSLIALLTVVFYVLRKSYITFLSSRKCFMQIKVEKKEH